ncbi:hypothetical protein HSBAA_36740 [Vreelandella sulfidaeris]|uniref:Uncharacterized protein n=1 Tax=Vreelandella sulfidaeris TaxID=115553 RepID=A0A455UDG2_9GAMM|nr:hypothetical protein HSBAA_36740 [Halomonas sulfidaeris]
MLLKEVKIRYQHSELYNDQNSDKQTTIIEVGSTYRDELGQDEHSRRDLGGVIMSRVPAQLPLGIGLRDDATFDNYFVARTNAPLLERITQQLSAEGGAVYLLMGCPWRGP